MGHMVSEFPLCWIWFIANLAVDPPVNKFDFSQIVFVSGFLHNGGILNFGGIPIALRATTFQLLQFCVSIGYYFFPLLPSCRTSGAKDLTTPNGSFVWSLSEAACNWAAVQAENVNTSAETTTLRITKWPPAQTGAYEQTHAKGQRRTGFFLVPSGRKVSIWINGRKRSASTPASDVSTSSIRRWLPGACLMRPGANRRLPSADGTAFVFGTAPRPTR